MLLATAVARVKLYAQTTSDPIVSDADIEALLAMVALEDEQGLGPAEAGWVGTWDIRAATRKAWELKAAKVVSDVDSDVDGARYNQSQMHAHCLAMADRYGETGSLSVRGTA